MCALKVHLEYPKELSEPNNDYSLAPDKTEIKTEMLSDYQLNIANLRLLIFITSLLAMSKN